MKLNHIALHIQNKEELIDFYQNILGFKLEYQYKIDSTLASTIFDIEEQTEIFRYSKDNLHLELFVATNKTILGFAHVGMDVEDREVIIGKCHKAGYQITRVERTEKQDLVFVSDKAGNKFELKNL
ncbi:MAG: VOC family protein [Dysgonamonadaceae bacterium]|nr:VOC family protein [Dysgonamonadaceae bacterium]MDD4727568.1 VOC family protein [Dysgonamonadaceae bacterium]